MITPLENEKYTDYIKRILNSRENKKDKDTYQERHHIIPKTLGGSNEKENLVYLYAQEHYYAHKLLAKENPSEKGLQLAWWNMCQCTKEEQRNYDISPDEYAQARESAAKAVSELRKGVVFSEEHKKNLRKRGKPVINLTTGQIYPNAKVASDETRVLPTHIGECCLGKISRTGQDENGNPYIWRFVGEENLQKSERSIFIQKKIKCIETGIIYESIRDAYRETGVARTTIKTDCEGTASRQNKKRKHFCYA